MPIVGIVNEAYGNALEAACEHVTSAFDRAPSPSKKLMKLIPFHLDILPYTRPQLICAQELVPLLRQIQHN